MNILIIIIYWQLNNMGLASFTLLTAVKLIDQVSKQVESGNIPCNLYIDLSKAFDTLSFDILIPNRMN